MFLSKEVATIAGALGMVFSPYHGTDVTMRVFHDSLNRVGFRWIVFL